MGIAARWRRPDRCSDHYRQPAAYAALKADGTVVTWGYSGFGGDSSDVAAYLTDVQTIFGTGDAFAR